MKLVVKNFGALKEVEIEIKPLLIFVGEARILGKLIAIFSDYLSTKNDFLGALKHFNIDYELKEQTYIYYQDQFCNYEYENGIFSTHVAKNLVQALEKESNLSAVFDSVGIKTENRIIHIPVERILITHIPENLYEPLENDMDFPKHILFFGAKYKKARKKLKNTHFDFLSKKPNLLKLTQSSSAFQTAIPLAFVVEYYSKNTETLFIIEAPELNLLPSTQKNLVDFLIKHCLNSDNQLIISTVSSYIVEYFSDWIEKNPARTGVYFFEETTATLTNCLK